MATMKGKRVLTSLYLDPPVYEALRRLSDETRVPQAVYLREAVDLLLKRYKEIDEEMVKARAIADRASATAEKKRARAAKSAAKHK
jgi:predicted DNA-binding protein